MSYRQMVLLVWLIFYSRIYGHDSDFKGLYALLGLCFMMLSIVDLKQAWAELMKKKEQK